MATETRAANIPALLKVTQTRGAQVSSEITALLKARNTCLWITSAEEARALTCIFEGAAAATYEIRTHDCDRGVCDATGKPIAPDMVDPSRALDYIATTTTRCVYVLLDWHTWIKDPTVQRKLKNLARTLESAPKPEMRALAILSYSGDVPPELAGVATILDVPLPDRSEIAATLDEICKIYPDMAPQNGAREASITAALGLPLQGAKNCFAKSLVTSKSIDAAIISEEKRRIVNGIPGLEWFDPNPRGLAAFGGADVLKAATLLLKGAYSPRARAYGLACPKGFVLVGPPGTGKSLFAKIIATILGVPLLRCDLNAAKGKFVGDSEKGVRRIYQIADTIGRCVLWIDEVEKQLGGASGPQGSDGGVSADQLGSFLSWMQEKKSEVFVLATANDVTLLPPELLRKGRFDDIWFIDLPTHRERAEVVIAALGEYRRDVATIDAARVAQACSGFVGAEIASLVPSAMLVAFSDGERAITTEDLLTAARVVVPLSKTAGEKIDKLRTWAKDKARAASTPEESTAGNSRNLDL
jgi:hypothetical protein